MGACHSIAIPNEMNTTPYSNLRTEGAGITRNNSFESYEEYIKSIKDDSNLIHLWKGDNSTWDYSKKEIVEKEINKRLSIVLEMPENISCQKLNTPKKKELALKLSGIIYNMQTKEERENKWFNTQKYIFIRVLLRFMGTNRNKRVNSQLYFRE